MTFSSHSVISDIVQNNFCSGCGICAGCCPHGSLSMVWRDDGDLVPTLAGKCPSSCDICLRICPFSKQAKSEDQLAKERFESVPGISVHKDIGFYLESFVGYSMVDQHRENGSSGGMATWVLEGLLLNDLVDAVICVGPTNNRGKLFSYQIISEVKELRQMSGSRYYPVDAGQVIRELITLKPDKRYAFIGLPCTLKGLRLAMNLIPSLNRSIVFVLGLVCGHLPNKYYTEYLSCLSQVQPDQLICAEYRRKKIGYRAGNYFFRATASDNRLGMDVSKKKIKTIWSNNYFQVNSCNFCDDVFSEVADAVFMDAWLPEYQQDYRGNSIIVSRHPQIRDILLAGHDTGTCCLNAIPIAKVSESQKDVIQKKRNLLGARLYYAESRNLAVPQKRFAPDKQMYQKKHREICAYMKIQNASKKNWPILKAKNRVRFPVSFLFFSLPLYWHYWMDRFQRILTEPSKLLRLVRKR